MPVIEAHKLDLNRLPAELAHLREPIYNGLDAALTSEIDSEMASLPSAKESAAVYGFELALQAPVLEMTLRGFRVDPMERDRAIAIGEAKLKATEKILKQFSQAIADFDVNPYSGQQLKRLFYTEMGIKPVFTFVKGEMKEQMDRDTIETMLNYFYARPIAYAALLARDLKKMLGTLKTEIDHDWRWRCSYNIGGTDSWRFSSSKSPFMEYNQEANSWKQTGSNFQNITSDLRRVFIADPGFKIAGIDKEQAESREVGFLCGVLFNDWSYLDACESGDLHTYTARLIWTDLPWTGDLKKDRDIADWNYHRHFTYRDTSKRCGHGTNYYGTPSGIANIVGVPAPLVQGFQERYFEVFPCIRRMHRWVASELQTKQHLFNVFGARRDFFDRPNTDETLRSAIAHLFQSATAMDLNLGLWRIWRHMPDVQLLAQLHDAVYFQFSEDEREADVIERAQELLKVELGCRGRKFVVPSEAKTGHNWAPRWKLDAAGNPIDWNPKGLDKVRMN